MSWLFWWKIDQAEIDRQVEGYKTLGFFKSARKLSVLCLAFSMILTGVFVYFGLFDTLALIDAGVFGFLALFIYLGHRWAMIGTMVLWTFEKGMGLIDMTSALHPNVVAISQVAFWVVFMHAFYLAFKVEQQRKRIARLGNSRLVEVFD